MSASESIFRAVLDAMQGAEDMGGPEGQEYVDLMNRIAAEASQRASNAMAWMASSKKEEE